MHNKTLMIVNIQLTYYVIEINNTQYMRIYFLINKKMLHSVDNCSAIQYMSTTFHRTGHYSLLWMYYI